MAAPLQTASLTTRAMCHDVLRLNTQARGRVCAGGAAPAAAHVRQAKVVGGCSATSSFATGSVRVAKQAAGCPRAGSQRGRVGVVTFAAGSGGPGGKNAPKREFSTAEIVAIGGALLSTTVISLAGVYGLDDVQDFLYGDGLGGYGPGGGIGTYTGALLWATSLYYATPYQLLLLFLGKIETDRPSDAVLKGFGTAAGFDVEALDYEAPGAVKAATTAVFIASGLATAYFFEWAFGEATWSISTGLGSCMAAAMYELGRPERLTVEQAQEQEMQWQDFAAWADLRLEAKGRCHFTEIAGAFRREPGNGRYRTEDGLSDIKLQNMIANWAPAASRSSAGYYKGVSLKPRVDPFVGQSQDAL